MSQRTPTKMGRRRRRLAARGPAEHDAEQIGFATQLRRWAANDIDTVTHRATAEVERAYQEHAGRWKRRPAALLDVATRIHVRVSSDPRLTPEIGIPALMLETGGSRATVQRALAFLRLSGLLMVYAWGCKGGGFTQHKTTYTAARRLTGIIRGVKQARSRQGFKRKRNSANASHSSASRGGIACPPIGVGGDGPVRGGYVPAEQELSPAELAEREQQAVAEQARREIRERAEQAAIAERRAKHDAWRRKSGLLA